MKDKENCIFHQLAYYYYYRLQVLMGVWQTFLWWHDHRVRKARNGFLILPRPVLMCVLIGPEAEI